MSQYGSNNITPILIDGYNVQGVITDISPDEIEAMLELNHALGDAWQKSYPTGLSKFGLGMKGFYDDTTGATLDAFVASNQANRVALYGLDGGLVGGRFRGFAGPLQTKVARLPSLGALTKLDVAFAGSGASEDGVILHPHGTETGATGDTTATSVDSNTVNGAASSTLIPITSNSKANPTIVTTTVPHGLTTNQVVLIAGVSGSSPTINGEQVVTVISPTTFSVPIDTSGAGSGGTGGTARALSTVNGGAAYLEIEALTLGGYTNLAVLVKHSSDNASFTTLGTFTVVTAAKRAQRLSIAAGTTVKRYLAMSWSYGGSGSGQSFKGFVGFARG